MMSLKEKFKIIYIIGTGRNGSTLLDIVLGNSEKIQSSGELFNTIDALKINKVCSCQKSANDCQFWSKVIKMLQKETGNVDFNNILAMQNYFERSLLSPLNFLFGKFFQTKKFRNYKRFLNNFYSAIALVSQKPVIVDSSKNFFRGYALRETFQDNVFYIHLVRDGRGQMWSWIKGGVMPPFNIPIRKNSNKDEFSNEHFWWAPIFYAFSWLLYNFLSYLVTARSHPRLSIQVQYENFTENPADLINRIAVLIDEDLSDLVNLLKKNCPLETAHILAGVATEMQSGSPFGGRTVNGGHVFH